MTSLPCPPEHWPRFSSLLDLAMDIPPEQRAEWVRRLPDSDAQMRPWLTRVLGAAASVSTNAFLDGPPVAAGSLRQDNGEEFSPGDVVGPYRLTALLGEGGMGRVWRARGVDADGPQREVALKLPHPELLSGPYRRRFRQERDVLGALSHPNIAALYDAGVSADGHPYLALELIQGQPINDYCKQGAVPLERRVDLIRAMLAALGYAHGQLIVHRDIKPSNVMVTTEGAVKLLDFGIAKLLDAAPDPSGEGPLTQPAARLATPGYGAPEQMQGGPITVSADLYAAGALLFELCTGTRLRPARRKFNEQYSVDAPLASGVADAAAAHLPDGPRLARRLRGDMDAIIARALSPEPLDRYQSAEAFSRDLRRWQEGLPVSARRIGRVAIATKFVRRNPAITALVSVLALSLAGGSAGIAWQAHRAEREAAHATATRDYLIGLFETGDPRNGGKPNDQMTARELLDIGADRADAAFASDPQSEVELLAALGQIYDAIDDGARAETVWSRRVDLLRKLYGPTDSRVVEATLQLVRSEVVFLGEDRAKALLESIRAPIFARYSADSLERAEWLAARAQSLRTTHGGREEALADDLEAVRIYENGHQKEPAYVDTLEDLSDYQYDSEQYQASLDTIEKLHKFEVATGGVDVMATINYAVYKAVRLAHLNRLEEADALYKQVEADTAAHLGPNSGLHTYAITSRAVLYHLRGERLRADQMFEDALGGNLNRAAATGLPSSLRRNYGAALAREGRAAEAIPVLEQALAEVRVHPRDEQNLRRTEGILGDAYDQVGRTTEARTLLRQARDEWLRYGPANGAQSQAASERWGRFLLDHGEIRQASAEFQAILDQSPKPPVIATALATADLARIAVMNDDLALADRQSAAAMEQLGRISQEYDVRSDVQVWLIRAEVLRRLGRTGDARALAQKAFEAATSFDAPGSARIKAAQDAEGAGLN
jgi:serine/threonine-protein kinase